MKTLSIIATVIALWTGTLLAATNAEVVDTTRFKVRTQAGVVEAVTLENLAVGETRSLQTEAGTPVVVGRHEQGYVLSINGERIEIEAPNILMTDSDTTTAHVLAGGQGKKMVVRIDDQPQSKSGEPQQHRKVVMIKRGADSNSTEVSVDGEEAQALLDGLDLADPQLADGKRVMVVRKIEKRVDNSAD